MSWLWNLFQWEYVSFYTYKDCEVYSLPSQGAADGTSFERYVTVIITARGELDQLCSMKFLVLSFHILRQYTMGIDKHSILYNLMQMSFHFTPMHHIEYSIFLQFVIGCVRMKGPWMKEPACVLV